MVCIALWCGVPRSVHRTVILIVHTSVVSSERGSENPEMIPLMLHREYTFLGSPVAAPTPRGRPGRILRQFVPLSRLASAGPAGLTTLGARARSGPASPFGTLLAAVGRGSGPGGSLLKGVLQHDGRAPARRRGARTACAPALRARTARDPGLRPYCVPTRAVGSSWRRACVGCLMLAVGC